jgi:hypothetical protein
MKILAALALACLSAFAQAQAAPWKLTAAAYPATAPQPSAATFNVNGGPQIACALLAVANGGIQPSCTLASITSYGTFTLVMIATFAAGCVNVANAATCTTGGVVSSAPFAFTYSSGLASSPVLSVTP